MEVTERPRSRSLPNRRHVLAGAMALLVAVAIWSASTFHARATELHADGRWVLQSAPASIQTGLLIKIHGDELTGRGPCNYFRSRWSSTDGPVGAIFHTFIGCSGDVLDREQRYLDLFSGAESTRVERGQLTISGKNGVLVFARRS